MSVMLAFRQSVFRILAMVELTASQELTDRFVDTPLDAALDQANQDARLADVAYDGWAPGNSNKQAFAEHVTQTLHNTPLWTQLTEGEQRLIYGYAHHLAIGEATWKIEGQPGDDNLFGLPEVHRTIEFTKNHLNIVSGLAMAGLVKEGVVEPADYQDYGFASKLSFLAAVGGYIASRKVHDFSNKEPTMLSINNNPYARSLMSITGDMHGDFMMKHTLIFPNGAIDPMGQHQPFAPIERGNSLNAYHSTEPSLVIGLFYWADQLGLSESDQKNLWNQGLERLEAAGVERPMFARTAEQVGGTDSLSSIILASQYRDRPTDGSADQIDYFGYKQVAFDMWLPGGMHSGIELFVTPSGQLAALPGGQHNLAEEDEESFRERIDQGIFFEPDDLAGLINLTLEQAMRAKGRTPVNNIVDMLNARFDNPDNYVTLGRYEAAHSDLARRRQQGR
ncbi:MAG: hypothetical protein QG553_87 [Patescibacteria group bacterium]|nr:hypothetical protein [Patescibacteria group bacterium]